MSEELKEELNEEVNITEDSTDEAQVDITEGAEDDAPAETETNPESTTVEVTTDGPGVNITPSNEGATEFDITDPATESKGISPKLIGVFAGLICVALIVFLVVFLLPANRIKRYVVSGNKAFEAGSYEKALTSFEKALNIDPSEFKAHKGAILAAGASGDTDLRDELALSAISIVKDYNKPMDDAKTLEGVELLLTAYEYLTDYKGQGAGLWDDLKKAYSTLGEPGELRPMMGEYAYNYGRATEDNIPLALTLFEEAYGYTDGSEPVAETAREYGYGYIDTLLASDDFEGARNVIEVYGDKFSFDKDPLALKIDNAESLYETKISFLTRVYENMAVYYFQGKDSFHTGLAGETEGVDIRMLAYDWFEMQNLDGSEAADLLAISFDGEPAIFSPEGYSADKEVVACGLYPYGGFFENAEGKLTTSYYFFLGNYVNGKREGYGISFIRTGETSFYVFEGMWHDDAPNGYGVLYRKNNYAHTQLPEYTDILFSDYVDGIQDGVVFARITANEYPGVVFEGTYEVKNGFGVEVPTKTDDYELLSEIPEGYVLIGVIPSVADGYSNYMIYRDAVGEKKGTIGY